LSLPSPTRAQTAHALSDDAAAHPDDAVVPDPSGCPNGRGPFGDPTAVGLPASFGLDCPSNSWSTGTDPRVNSIYQRILARNPAIAGNIANWATTAVSVSDLARQAGLAAGQGRRARDRQHRHK
jgi:hypothetical protein